MLTLVDNGEDRDWVLPKGESAWIQCGPFSIWIRHYETADGKSTVVVEACPHGYEADETIDALMVEEQ